GETAASGPLIGQMLAVAAVSRSSNDAAKAHLEALAEGKSIAALAFGDSEYVPCAKVADFFLTGKRDGAISLVEAGKGVTIESVHATDRSRSVSKVSLDGAQTHELFAKGDPRVAKLFDAALGLIAADALGGAQKCTDMSVEYAKDREQFGQPIGQSQALKH